MEQSICICGGGTMGKGIALATAFNNCKTILFDVNDAVILAAEEAIEKELTAEVEKKKISAETKNIIRKRFLFTSSIGDCVAPLIIEAIVENAAVKASLFAELAALNSSDTFFLTNTSSLSVTEIAKQTAFPERIAGLHFFNPANKMKLVEIIQTEYNNESFIKRISDFSLQIKKIPVICRDAPGFIVNRVARPFYIEALRIAGEGITDPETIDRLMESAGFKMGPFHLMDMIGQDINYTVSCSLYEALGRPKRLQPSPLQSELVKKGLLGRKTGKGFFSYSNKKTTE